jgi:rod shape-determining protein MreD
MKTRFLFILTILVLFVLEGTVVQVVLSGWSDLHLAMVPRFVVVMLIFSALFLGRVQGLIMGLSFGLLYDVVYGSVIGIYAFTMAIVAYFTGLVFKIFQQNIFLILLTVLLALVAFEFMVYGLFLLISVANLSVETFFFEKVLPSLILNMIFALLVAYPARLILVEIEQEEN